MAGVTGTGAAAAAEPVLDKGAGYGTNDSGKQGFNFYADSHP